MKLDKLVKLEKDKQIQVKAGDSLGKLGAYDSKTIDNKEKLIHLEVFTFGDWDGFKKKSKDAYEKEDEKTRPKAKLHIPKNVQRYEKEGYTTKFYVDVKVIIKNNNLKIRR